MQELLAWYCKLPLCKALISITIYTLARLFSEAITISFECEPDNWTSLP